MKTQLMVLVVLLAGCSAPNQESEEPNALEVPIWSVGDYWNYKDSKDQWQNWSVEAKESRNGYETYRVRVQSAGPEYRTFNTTTWMDVDSLGVVEFGSNDPARQESTTRISPPGKQLFPLTNRTYETSWTYPHLTYQQTAELSVNGWWNVDVPAGTFQALAMDTWDKEARTPVFNGYYAPPVGYLVSYGSYDPFELMAWHHQIES